MSSSKAPQLRRAAVVSALHDGMTDAVHDFSAWTGGEYLCDWGVEGLMTSACARRLAREATTVGSKSLLTLEQRFADIIEFSGRQPERGRPSDAARRLAAKMSGRVDIVLWNVDGTPRAMIEIKRDAGVKGLTTDAERVIDFVKSAGRTYKGSVRYGLVATVVGGPASKGQDGVRAKAAKRLKALAHRATKRDMVFSCEGPRWLGPLDTFGEEIAATYVFGFSPRRPK